MDDTAKKMVGSAAESCSIPCNVCGYTRVREVANRDRDGRPLRTVMCDDCGLVWTDPRPDADEIRRFYTHDYRSAYKGAAEPKRKHVLRETRRAIARFRRIEPMLFAGARVLDVGAGAGFFPHVLQSRGFDILGIEPNRGYCEWGMANFGVKVRNGTLQDFDFADQPFDLITLNHVLEHLPDPAEALGRLRSWLAPHGLLVIEVPNVESEFHAPGKRFHIGHLYNFNQDNLVRLARSVGLERRDLLLQPVTGHINVVFAVTEPEDASADRRLPASAKRVAEALHRHSAFRHYASPATYLRTLAKWVGYLGERARVAGGISARQIADREIGEAFGSAIR